MEKYIPQDIERSGKAYGQNLMPIKRLMITENRRITCWKCSLILRETCIWGMCVTTLSVMLLPAIAV